MRTRDHLANTRTLVAWVRLALVLLGLGFVVTKLQILAGSGRATLGLGVAVSGVLVTAAAAARFLLQRREIEGPVFRSHHRGELVVAALAAAGGGLVLAFLVATR